MAEQMVSSMNEQFASEAANPSSMGRPPPVNIDAQGNINAQPIAEQQIPNPTNIPQGVQAL
jgi:hypothetical protein